MSAPRVIYEVKIPKFFIVEDRSDVVPFLIKVVGVPPSKSVYMYFVGLDLSWSMEGESIFVAKRVVTDTIKLLGSSSYVNIYGFCRKVYKIAEMVSNIDLEKIAKAVFSAKLGGGTNIYAFLDHVYKDCRKVEEEFRKKDKEVHVKNILILISDGFPTAGIKKHSKIIEIAKKLKDCISTSIVLGIGEKVNHKLLEDIAHNTNGIYTQLVDVLDVPKIVEKVLPGLRDVVALDVKFTIRIANGIGVQVYNKRTYATGQGVEIEVGDIFGDEEVDIIGEFVVPPQKRGSVALGTIQGAYRIGDRQVPISPTNIVVPCVSAASMPSGNMAVNDVVYREINIVKTATTLARDIYGSISVEKLKHILEKLINTTIAIEYKDLYAKTIDLRVELEKEGIPPQLVDKIITLLYKVIIGRT